MSLTIPADLLLSSEEAFQGDLLRYHPNYFINKIFGYTIWDHHQKILDHYFSEQETLDEAPRGCGKTRIGTIGYGAWRAVNDPDLRILITSDTDQHATRFLNTIKNAIEFHPLIKKHYGDLKGDRWSDHEAILAGRTKILTESTFTAHGAMSGAVTSGHYDIILADDLVNFANARTEGEREKMIDWFKLTLLPTLIPGGEIHVLGTRYHFLDLYKVLEGELGYDVQIQRAIETDTQGEEISIWEPYMPLDDRVEGIDPRTGKPKITKGLRTIRDKVGSIVFNLQYQNDVALMMKGDIFQFDWFKYFDFTTVNGEQVLEREDGQMVKLSDLKIYMGVDPAVSEKDTADYFVICIIGISKTKPIDCYVLDIVRDRFSYEMRAQSIAKKWNQWKPRVVGIENVAFQKDFCDRIRHTFPFIRVKEIKTTRDKVSRAYNRSGLVQNGHVWVRSGMSRFVEELCLMPGGEHDDQFDGFDFAMWVGDSSPEGGVLMTTLPGYSQKDDPLHVSNETKLNFRRKLEQ